VDSALRFTVRATEALTSHDVLTENVDGSTETLFDMQNRLAAIVDEGLNRAVPSPVRQSTPAPKLTAYECYVKGRQALGFQRGSSQEARELFKQAVDMDPEYAPALAGLAAVDARDHIYTTDPTLLDSAKDYAQRAIAADPRNVEAHMWLGYVLLFQEEWEEGYREETRAMELDPSAFDAPYFAAGLFLVPRSRRDSQRLCEQILSDRLTSIGAMCVLSAAGEVIDMSDLTAETGIAPISVADFASRAAGSTSTEIGGQSYS
jgi:adenylate cyclase